MTKLPELGRSSSPRPQSFSDFPTLVCDLAQSAESPVPLPIDLESTLPIEPTVLAQLCAESQVSERRRLLPMALEYSVHVQVPMVLDLAGQPASHAPAPARSAAVRPSADGAQRWQSVLLLGAGLGLSIAAGTAWRLDMNGSRAARVQPAAVGVPRVLPMPQESPGGRVPPSPVAGGNELVELPRLAPILTVAHPRTVPALKSRPAARPPASGRKPAPTRVPISPSHGSAPRPVGATGAESPSAGPTIVRRLYGRESVLGTYRGCMHPSGFVRLAIPSMRIPMGDDVLRTLPSWHLAPMNAQPCLDLELQFEIDGTDSAGR